MTPQIHGPREVLEPFTVHAMRQGEKSIPLNPPLQLEPGDRVLTLTSGLLVWRGEQLIARYQLHGDTLEVMA